jgi:hypothetical protein
VADPSLPSSALHCCQDHAAEAVGDDEHERCGDDEQDRCDIPHNHAANHTPHRDERSRAGLRPFEQFEHVAAAVPSDLLAGACPDDDHHRRVAERLAAALADRRRFWLAAHGGVIGISDSRLQRAQTSGGMVAGTLPAAAVRRCANTCERVPDRPRIHGATSLWRAGRPGASDLPGGPHLHDSRRNHPMG